ncbi:MAG TPA: adenylate/guanylate cyclase domain-containing protein [Geminicoccus sp.]|uniref:adenylate/guanylate cyclase domain-containing protein n=1 Tax=Geminicoccus sp. TaxID=2024832 RepID=UPI002CA87CA2|nr:adenylate/guanylate cyclase domain-containing protein [Geminicoccus sp.]HWL68770.1 adenylate/guanylate cyclase domain-containing protein [Geminicoccus sp.]
MEPAEHGPDDGLVDLIIRQVAEGGSLAALFSALCERLLQIGLPVWRTSLSMRAIDPIVTASSLYWHRDKGVGEPVRFGLADRLAYERSPIAHVLGNGLGAARWRIENGEGCARFPLLAELRVAGGTDYLMRIVGFTGQVALPGIALSIATDRPGGFTLAEIRRMDQMLPALGLACHRFALEGTLADVLSVYLGPRTAGRVLAGEIMRGTGRRITAAILLADLRGFTALSAQADPMKVVGWLNEHLEAMGAPIDAAGGEILKFTGDGLLAVFTADDGAEPAACARALAAAEAMLAATAGLNRARCQAGLPQLGLGVVLHHGEVVYGNVGAVRRLDFTAIGPAVNEASRLEKLCGRLGRELLLSGAFAVHCTRPLRRIGAFRLRGVNTPIEVLEPEAPWTRERGDAPGPLETD